MKIANLLGTILLSLSIIGFSSCNNDNDKGTVAVKKIAMEAEGGDTEIQIADNDWYISNIVNNNGNVNISGDVYDNSGKLVRENNQLKLKGLGRMESHWNDKGFTVSRENSSTLKVRLDENMSGKFDFTIILKSTTDEEIQEIVVSQKSPQGYAFEKIAYSIEKGDCDSIYWKLANSFEFNNQTKEGGKTIDCPFKGNLKSSYFKSSANDAFVWLAKDSIKVEIPGGISNNSIYLNHEKELYTDDVQTSTSLFKEIEVPINYPIGQSKCHIDIEMIQTKVTYTLTLKNNRTQAEKEIKGKWIGISPNGEYKLVWDK